MTKTVVAKGAYSPTELMLECSEDFKEFALSMHGVSNSIALSRAALWRLVGELEDALNDSMDLPDEDLA